MRRLRIPLAILTACVITATAAACDSSKTPGQEQPKKDTMVFGLGGDPQLLDPALAFDDDSFRITRQIFETLVRHDEGGTAIVGGLAESFGPDASGKVWTFKLRQGVKFQDDTDFNAAAVCANFDRWFHFTGVLQQRDVTYAWQDTFGGFAKNELPGAAPSLYKGCAASDTLTAVLTITHPTSKLPAALAQPAFAMSSPKAMHDFEANKVVAKGAGFTYPEYALAHPVGTGPFKLVKWDKTAKTLELGRFDGYWGGPAKLKSLTFKTIIDLETRKKALRDGEIQGFDQVNNADAKMLAGEGFQLLVRPAFTVVYLAFNQAGNPALRKPEVREAIAAAINKKAIVDAVYPAGAVANSFCPPNLAGCDTSAGQTGYDPEKAKSLLAAAGITSLTLRMHYPTQGTGPLAPTLKDVFDRVRADLQAVGITIQPIAQPWSPTYLRTVQYTAGHDLHLLYRTGDYGDAQNFLGVLFDRQRSEWGFTDQALFGQFAAADSEPDQAKRAQLYQGFSAAVGQLRPGVPLAYAPSTLVLAKDVTGIVASPVRDERFGNATYK